MVNTSARPVSVDGVRLDTLAWNVERIDRATAQRRSGNYNVPNLDGVVASLNDTLETATYGLAMWLRGTDADGAVPVSGSLTELRDNLDELLHLFGQRHKLLDLREVVDGSGTERRCWAKVEDSLAPDLNTAGSAGTFVVALTIPAGLWEDVNASDWVGASGTGINNVVQTVTPLTGSAERITDGIYVVDGPITNPVITDLATGMNISLTTALTTGQSWRFNSSTWASRYGAGISVVSSDTTGTDGTAVTGVGGPSRGYGLPLTPVRVSSVDPTRVVQARLSGTGLGATTRLSVRARRKYGA